MWKGPVLEGWEDRVLVRRVVLIWLSVIGRSTNGAAWHRDIEVVAVGCQDLIRLGINRSRIARCSKVAMPSVAGYNGTGDESRVMVYAATAA